MRNWDYSMHNLHSWYGKGFNDETTEYFSLLVGWCSCYHSLLRKFYGIFFPICITWHWKMSMKHREIFRSSLIHLLVCGWVAGGLVNINLQSWIQEPKYIKTTCHTLKRSSHCKTMWNLPMENSQRTDISGRILHPACRTVMSLLTLSLA